MTAAALHMPIGTSVSTGCSGWPSHTPWSASRTFCGPSAFDTMPRTALTTGSSGPACSNRSTTSLTGAALTGIRLSLGSSGSVVRRGRYGQTRVPPPSFSVAYSGGVDVDSLVGEWLTLPDLADRIGEPLPKVRQMLREGRLVAVARGRPPVKQVPAELVHDGRLVKGLAGALTVLRDAGYSDVGALRWLLTEDDVIASRPIEAMAAGRDTAVKRRAQVLAF